MVSAIVAIFALIILAAVSFMIGFATGKSKAAKAANAQGTAYPMQQQPMNNQNMMPNQQGQAPQAKWD